MKKSILTVTLLLFFLVGCADNAVQQEKSNGEESEKLTNPKTQLDELKNQIAELKTSPDTQFNLNEEINDELLLVN